MKWVIIVLFVTNHEPSMFIGDGPGWVTRKQCEYFMRSQHMDEAKQPGLVSTYCTRLGDM